MENIEKVYICSSCETTLILVNPAAQSKRPVHCECGGKYITKGVDGLGKLQNITELNDLMLKERSDIAKISINETSDITMEEIKDNVNSVRKALARELNSELSLEQYRDLLIESAKSQQLAYEQNQREAKLAKTRKVAILEVTREFIESLPVEQRAQYETIIREPEGKKAKRIEKVAKKQNDSLASIRALLAMGNQALELERQEKLKLGLAAKDSNGQ